MLALGVDDRAVSLGATDHLASKHELEMSKKKRQHDAHSSKVDIAILLSDHVGENLPTVIRVVALA